MSNLSPEEKAIIAAHEAEDRSIIKKNRNDLNAAIAESIADAANSAPIPTYIYMGHGADLLMPKYNDETTWVATNENEVPSNCTYSTISESGDPANLGMMLHLNSLVINPEYKAMLLNPKDHYDGLSILTTGQEGRDPLLHRGVFHFKKEKDKYINRNCDFVLSFPDPINGGHIIFRSGLYNIANPIMRPLPFDPGNKYHIYDEEIHRDFIAEIYKDSIFPTAIDVINECNKLSGIEGVIRYDMFKLAVSNLVSSFNQSELFTRFPGNHFNFSCRNYDRTHPIRAENKQLARQLSANIAAAKPRPRFNRLVEERHAVGDDRLMAKFRTNYDMGGLFCKFSLKDEISPAQIVLINKMMGYINDDIKSGTLHRLDIPQSILKCIDILIKRGIIKEGLMGGKRTTRKLRKSKKSRRSRAKRHAFYASHR